ncbi:MAG: hypothetical protein ABIJ40_18270 [Bacteroidota bacterium]
MVTKIEAIEINKTGTLNDKATVDKINIWVEGVNLGESATVKYYLGFEDESGLHNEFESSEVLSGQEYQAWGEDDGYIETWLLNKLGYVKEDIK